MPTEPYIGQVMLFAGNYAPEGWAFCDGTLMSINQYTALFSLIGTYYGGDGQTTFALPDLRGRAPLHFGQGPGLSSYSLGENGGAEMVTLFASQMPAHSHAVMGFAGGGTSAEPASNVWASGPASLYAAGAAADGILNPTVISPSGGSQPHDNMPPFLTLNYCIALEGIFPSRS